MSHVVVDSNAQVVIFNTDNEVDSEKQWVDGIDVEFDIIVSLSQTVVIWIGSVVETLFKLFVNVVSMSHVVVDSNTQVVIFNLNTTKIFGSLNKLHF